MRNNFHGRTVTIVSFSTEEQYRYGFGPLRRALRRCPSAMPMLWSRPLRKTLWRFWLSRFREKAEYWFLPRATWRKWGAGFRHNVLMMLDEIQTGLGRTGRLFAYEYDDAKPDVWILGKALGGGVYPVSAMLSNADVMDVFGPGDHGSTFGGNPLGCAAGMAALQVIEEESLVERAFTLGKYFREELEKIQSPYVQEVRGKGLLIGVEIKKEHGTARPFCERLMKLGLLCKETHDYTIRFAPPLTITKDEIDWSLEKIAQVLT